MALDDLFNEINRKWNCCFLKKSVRDLRAVFVDGGRS